MPDVKPPLWRTLTRAGILVGVLAMLVGLALWDILDRTRFASATVLIPFGGGAVLVLAGLLLNLGWLRGAVSGRKFLVGLNVWAMVALSVALLVIANAIVGGTPQTDAWSLDLTSNKVYTLSDQTRNILKGLQKEVAITVFSSGDDESAEVAQRVKDMLPLYRAQSRKLQVEILDLYRDKTRAEQIALRIKNQSGADQVRRDSILVECGKKSVNVSFSDLFQMPPMSPMSMEAPTRSFTGEEKITGAILSVTEEKQATIYFTTGHGEMDIAGGEEAALNQFVIELKRDNYRIERLNLRKTNEVPADCDLIVIAGSMAPFQDNEVKLLRGYLEKNGAMLVLARPRYERGSLGGLDKLLADYNVQVRDDEMVIQVYQVLGSQVVQAQMAVEEYGRHPIAEGLKNWHVVLPYVSPVKPAVPEPPSSPYGQPPEPASPWQAVVLMQSAAEVWGVTDLTENQLTFHQGVDEKGPLSLGVAVSRRKPAASPYAPPPPEPAEPGPRLVVLGSVAVATDEVLSQSPGDRALLANSVNWLVKKETKLGIRPQRTNRRDIVASPARLKAVFFISILGMPLAAVLLGGFVWWFRRR